MTEDVLMPPICRHCRKPMTECGRERDRSSGELRVSFSCDCRRDSPYRHTLTDRRKKS
jgi:hypothetical protein